MRRSKPRHRAIPERLRRRFLDHVPPIYTHPDTLLVAFGFRCNLACTFCMVEDALDVYPGAPLEVLQAFVADEEAIEGITTIVLSGGEVTLDDGLLPYIEAARRAPGVQHVRIQTNATRLHDRALLKRLIDAGVDELFVSLHGATDEVCDRITQRPGSFKAILRGIDAIAASDAVWMSNTCIVTDNVHQLADIATIAAERGAVRAEFWNVWPRIDKAPTRQGIVPVGTIAPELQGALRKCRESGLSATVKWFPRCLLGDFGELQDDSQPTSLIDAKYWATLPSYRCLYAGVCAHGQTCSGLSSAYVQRHGWEVDRLRPARGAEAALRDRSEDRADPIVGAPSAATSDAWRPAWWRDDIPWPDGWQERGLTPVDGGCRVALARSSSVEPEVQLRVLVDDGEAPAFRRAGGWRITYESPPHKALQAPAMQLATALAAFLEAG